MSGGGLGLVKDSKGGKFQEGDVVSGFVPWSSFFVADAASQVC
jgi:NADPH-dependent curcumin reductase CurA